MWTRLKGKPTIFTLQEPRCGSIIAESASHRFTKSDTKTYYRKDPVKYALKVGVLPPAAWSVRVAGVLRVYGDGVGNVNDIILR
uniref:DUF5110 domain-containing protein n=1 Tax=Panagrellus redivivus TaxID=6233 RepID=A0A7E4W1R1_PANRE